jgi:hypothetical protein
MVPRDLNRGFWLVQNKIQISRQNLQLSYSTDCSSFEDYSLHRRDAMPFGKFCINTTRCHIAVYRSIHIIYNFNGRWSKLGIRKRYNKIMPCGSSHLTYAQRHTEIAQACLCMGCSDLQFADSDAELLICLILLQSLYGTRTKQRPAALDYRSCYCYCVIFSWHKKSAN